MAHELIALWGVRVGSVEGTETIRHSFAFDLRDVDLRDRPLISAALELPAAVVRNARSVELSDPADRILYGCARQATAITQVELSSLALSDLQDASGGFFTVDAEFDDDNCEPLCLAGAGERRLMLLAVADVERENESSALPVEAGRMSAA